VTEVLVMERLAVPALDSVTVLEPESSPVPVSLKSQDRLCGLPARTGVPWNPVPVSATVFVPRLVGNDSVPDCVVPAVGTYATEVVHEAPAATLEAQVLPVRE
jgi:hypothetical protein